MQWHPDPASRKAHHSLKWSAYPADQLPLWVADLDCAPPPAVAAVIQNNLDHGIFGYGMEPPGFRDAWVQHLGNHHDWSIDPDWIVPVAGVVPAMRLALLAHPERRDVITPRPVYPYFHAIPREAGLTEHAVEFSHTAQGLFPDRDRLAAALKAPRGPSAMLWCNPHNPGGTVYGEADLLWIVENARAHQTLLISDEIWADLRLESRPHIPLGRIAEPDQPTITLMAATKTFNIAGFPCAVAIIPEPQTRRTMQQILHAMPHITPLAYQITEAVLQNGWTWHASLIRALKVNRERVHDWAAQHPELLVTTGDASFLAWIKPHSDIESGLGEAFAEAGVRLSDGRPFGRANACRLNFGCHPTTLETALKRMDRVLDARKR